MSGKKDKKRARRIGKLRVIGDLAQDRKKTLLWDRRKGTIVPVEPGPGDIIETDIKEPIGLFGADAEKFAKMTRAERRRAHVYKCELCQGPVYTMREYRAKEIRAFCSGCSGRMKR